MDTMEMKFHSAESTAGDNSIGETPLPFLDASDSCCPKDCDAILALGDRNDEDEFSFSTDLDQEPNVVELQAKGNYATTKNMTEGLMDIALLSANANQLRFLITYNGDASTFLYSLIMVIFSLSLQVVVGILLIAKRFNNDLYEKRYDLFVVTGVFLITVINVLLAAFTTTDKK